MTAVSVRAQRSVVRITTTTQTIVVQNRRTAVRIASVGVQGRPGNKGDPGDDGDPGLSAYQVALANGFVGTEAEWLASLQGAPGPQGPAGEGIDPANKWEFYVDFGNGAALASSAALGAEITRTLGTGSTILSGNSPATGAGYVITRNGAGTTSECSVHTVLTAILQSGGAEIDFRFKGAINALSDNTNAFTAVLGIANAFAGAISWGYYFRYTHNVNGGRFEAVRKNLGSDVGAGIVDTGVTVIAGQEHFFRILVSPDRSSAKFFIDGAEVADLDSPPLTSTRVMGFGFGATKSAGSAVIDTILADLLHCKLTFASPRYSL